MQNNTDFWYVINLISPIPNILYDCSLSKSWNNIDNYYSINSVLVRFSLFVLDVFFFFFSFILFLVFLVQNHILYHITLGYVFLDYCLQRQFLRFFLFLLTLKLLSTTNEMFVDHSSVWISRIFLSWLAMGFWRQLTEGRYHSYHVLLKTDALTGLVDANFYPQMKQCLPCITVPLCNII